MKLKTLDCENIDTLSVLWTILLIRPTKKYWKQDINTGYRKNRSIDEQITYIQVQKKKKRIGTWMFHSPITSRDVLSINTCWRQDVQYLIIFVKL